MGVNIGISGLEKTSTSPIFSPSEKQSRQIVLSVNSTLATWRAGRTNPDVFIMHCYTSQMEIIWK